MVGHKFFSTFWNRFKFYPMIKYSFFQVQLCTFVQLYICVRYADTHKGTCSNVGSENSVREKYFIHKSVKFSISELFKF